MPLPCGDLVTRAAASPLKAGGIWRKLLSVRTRCRVLLTRLAGAVAEDGDLQRSAVHLKRHTPGHTPAHMTGHTDVFQPMVNSAMSGHRKREAVGKAAAKWTWSNDER